MNYNLRKTYTIALLISFTFISTFQTSTIEKNEQLPIGSNPYTYAPLLFNAENGIMGKYWAGNEEYPAKAYIENTEYNKIVCIDKSKLKQKSKKKLRKNKDYLGSYINAETSVEYNLYGSKKNPKPIDDSPDGDVITMIAIKNDYGDGE